MSSTIHRFTPPTCTLEITEKKLFFSGWLSSNILPNCQFKLKFDDPRQTTFKQITIQGDRQDLLQLQTVINCYVQMRLQSSFQTKAIETTPKRDDINEKPYLTPLGLMHHELFFGRLTHDSQLHSLKLSTIQLFDLATALEASQTETMVSGSKPQALPKIIALGGGIAAVALTAIAIITVVKPQMQPEIATNTQPQSSIKIPELNEITPPSLPDPHQKTAKPKLREPIASITRLPPPPAVETPKPKPNIPDPADYRLSDVARQSGLNNSVKNKNINNRETKSARINPQTASKTDVLEQIPTATISPQAKTNLVKPAQDLAVKSSSNQPSQAEQITAYFENKWQPPAELKQSLEYRLILNRNGSIIRIIPLGKAAQLYLNQTNIPVNGEAFISPLTKSQPDIIRLLLNPDGQVQVFTESK
ncbi:MAG: DUF4335 domain-containing protein [Pleurocapsa sp. SU_5_0]|nr:DUF4335 domain-containing protein [Pleurocapsa sp. SU_5_0]